MARKKKTSKKTSKKRNAGKTTTPSECTKLDQLFSSEQSFVEMGFTLLESLLKTAKIRQYYKKQLKVEDGVVTEPSAFTESTRVRLLLLLAPFYSTLVKPITKLNLENCRQKNLIVPLLYKLSNLEEVNLSLTWRDDDDNLDLDSLLEDLSLITNLKRLRLDNWTNLTVMPGIFDDLEKVSCIHAQIPFPNIPKFQTLSPVIQMMFIERLKSSWREKDKDRYDSYVTVDCLFEQIDDLAATSLGLLKCNDTFYQQFQMSSHALYTVLSHSETVCENVSSITLDSSIVGILTYTPNVSSITLTVDSTCKKIELHKLSSLTNLTMIGMPPMLRLKNNLDLLALYGSVQRFQTIQVGRKKYTDLYEAMSVNGGQYGSRRYYYNSENYPEICDLPALSKHSVSFVSQELCDKMWRLKETDFWMAYLELSAEAKQTLLAKVSQGMSGKVGKWSKLGEYDFLWNFLVEQKVSDLPKYILVESKVVKHIQSPIEGLYIQLKKSESFDLRGFSSSSLKIRGTGNLLSCSVSKSLKEVNLERVHLESFSWDACAKSLISLTLVNMRKQDLPDLTQFTNLKTLKIIQCGVDSLYDLPTSLRHLSISGNPLQKFPESIVDCTKLEVLEMASCPFDSVPSSIKALSSLTKLSMTSSSLIDLKFLATLPKLHTLRIGYSLDSKPWHIRYKRLQAMSKPVPMLPAGLSNLRHLILHDAVGITLGAYKDHVLDLLDIQYAGEGTGVHAIKQFKHIRKLRGFLPSDTQPTVSPGVATPVEQMLPPYSRFARNGTQNSNNYPAYTLGYFTEMDPKFQKGLVLYQSMLKK